ncbi:MAG: efflux RND transporter periplasmic adaptor subunit [Xanthomonadales bacterium]|nr:efflux RND transporter periplasmic adaptor subunit [Xanthomonadales bacterium]
MNRPYATTLKLAATLMLITTGCSRPVTAAPDSPPLPVQTGTVIESQFAPELWVPASVSSRHDARVASLVAGRVRQIVELGEQVDEGQVLAQLEDRDLSLQAAEQEAAMQVAQARLSLAENQLQRLTALGSARGVAPSQLDQVRGERDIANQELRRARALRDQVAHRVHESKIRAPFSGTVAEQLVQIGEYVPQGAPVVRLVDLEGVDVTAQAPVQMAGQLQPGQPVRMRAGATDYRGSLRAVVPVGDQRSRQMELRITPASGDFTVGSALEVALTNGEPVTRIGVPRDALVLRADNSYVYRVNDQNKVERVTVAPGGANGDWVAVTGAIRPGERVVIRGAERLSDGQLVVEAELAAGNL